MCRGMLRHVQSGGMDEKIINRLQRACAHMIPISVDLKGKLRLLKQCRSCMAVRPGRKELSINSKMTK